MWQKKGRKVRDSISWRKFCSQVTHIQRLFSGITLAYPYGELPRPYHFHQQIIFLRNITMLRVFAWCAEKRPKNRESNVKWIFGKVALTGEGDTYSTPWQKSYITKSAMKYWNEQTKKKIFNIFSSFRDESSYI